MKLDLKKYKDHNAPPFIIAELSANHKNSLKLALKIIDEVSTTGANAIKIQSFLPEEITLNIKNKYFKINDQKSLWNNKYLIDLYNEASTPFDWHRAIFDRAKKKGLFCFSSVFGDKSFKFLESINAPAYKIASFENNHFPLIEKVSKTGKPVIISTGLAELNDLEEIVKIFKKNKNNNFCFLKCTSNYPASLEDVNLINILELQKKFNCAIGLSDHTIDNIAAITSVALGSRIIEKHVKLNDKLKSLDSVFSLSVKNFEKFVNSINQSYISLGKKGLFVSNNEKKSIIFKRSIFISNHIKKGEKFSSKNIQIVRPSHGLHPKYYKKLIGRVAKSNYSKGYPTNLAMLK